MASIWKTLTDLWKNLTLPQRLSLGGAGALTVALLLGIIWWSQKPDMALLFGGLNDQAEASRIIDELKDQKVSYTLGNQGRSIFVPSKLVYDMRLKLAAKGMPKGGTGGSGVGFEVLDKPSFGLSDFLQKAQYIRALQTELGRTISQMEEVESARIVIVMPNEHLFTAEKAESKASVFLQLRGQSRLNRQQVNAIRFLVANGVEGLKPAHVAIIDNLGTLLAEDDNNSSSGLTSSQIEVKKTTENLYASKIQTMFDQVLGPNQSVVRVTVDLDFDTKQQTEERFDPASQVVRSENLSTEENVTPIRDSARTPGVANNTAPGAEGASTTKGPDSSILLGTSKKQTTSNQYEINKTVQSVIKGVGEIRKVSVACFVNQREGAKGKPAAARTEAELKTLGNVIKRAVGFVEEGKGHRNDELALEEISFAPVNTGPEIVQVVPAAGWLPKVVLGVMAAGLLGFFWFMLRSAKADRLKRELALERLSPVAQVELPITVSGLLTPPSTGPITVEELSKLIRENPANMAQALKKWIN